MCRRLIYLIPFVFVLSLAGYASAADPNALIPSASTQPLIDGIKEDAWLASKEHKCVNTVTGRNPRSAADFSCSWWALWDTDYLYVFMDVNDDKLWNDSMESYKDDTAEIFIDIGNDDLTSYGEDDYQWFIPWNIDPNVKDIESNQGARGLVGVEYIIFETGDGYTLEIKIPWTTLDYLDKGISLGDEIGFEAQIDDDDNGDDRERSMAWFNTENIAWQNPSAFGTVKLAGGLKAGSPKPQNGAEGVVLGLMQWTAGGKAKSHNVYFGTNPTPGDDEFRCNQTGTMYQHLASFEPAITYYWRIDEVNDGNVWPGDVWHFTTAPLAGKQP